MKEAPGLLLAPQRKTGLPGISTWEAETGGLEVQSLVWLHIELGANLQHMRSSKKKITFDYF